MNFDSPRSGAAKIRFIAFEQFILCFYFVTIPFMWSYVAIVGGIPVRMSDVCLVLIIGFTLMSGPLVSSRFQNQIVIVFFVLAISMALSIMVNFHTEALIHFVKISFYFLGAVCTATLLVRNQNEIPARMAIGVLLTVILYIVLVKPAIIYAVIDGFSNAVTNPISFMYRLWASIFEINLFRSKSELNLVGVSFRNTTGIGFFCASIFYFAQVRQSRYSTFIVIAFLMLAIFTFSRSAGLVAFFFLVLWLLFNNSVQSRLFIYSLIGLVAFLVSGSLLLDAFVERVTADVRRDEIFILGLQKFLEAPVFGSGLEKSISLVSHIKLSVHNVPLALGVEFGLVAMLTSFMIVWLFLRRMITSLNRLRQSHSPRERVIFIGMASASFALFLRPMVSGSSDVFFARPEWALAALIFAWAYEIEQSESG